jgi:hypothetical protein
MPLPMCFSRHLRYFTIKNAELLGEINDPQNFQLRVGSRNPGTCPSAGEPVYMMIELDSWYDSVHPRLLMYKALEPWCTPGYGYANWTVSEHLLKVETYEKVIYEPFTIRRFNSMEQVHHFLVQNLFLLIDPNSTPDFKRTPVFMHAQGRTWVLMKFWPKNIHPVLDESCSQQVLDALIAHCLFRENNNEEFPETVMAQYLERLSNQTSLFEDIKNNWFDSDPCTYTVASLYHEAVTKNSIYGVPM